MLHFSSSTLRGKTGVQRHLTERQHTRRRPSEGFADTCVFFAQKRRYSAFYGTDLEILLKGLKVDTLLLVGGLTNVCVHYTFLDGHQGDYYCRVIEDCVAGSSTEAHEAALIQMEYLLHGARCSHTDVIEALAKE